MKVLLLWRLWDSFSLLKKWYELECALTWQLANKFVFAGLRNSVTIGAGGGDESTVNETDEEHGEGQPFIDKYEWYLLMHFLSWTCSDQSERITMMQRHWRIKLAVHEQPSERSDWIKLTFQRFSLRTSIILLRYEDIRYLLRWREFEQIEFEHFTVSFAKSIVSVRYP